MILLSHYNIILLGLILFFVSLYKSKVLKSSKYPHYNKVLATAYHGRNVNHLFQHDKRKNHLTHKLFFLKKEKNDSYFKGINNFKSFLKGLFVVNEICKDGNEMLIQEEGEEEDGAGRTQMGSVSMLGITLGKLMYPPHDVQRFVRCYLFPSRDGGRSISSIYTPSEMPNETHRERPNEMHRERPNEKHGESPNAEMERCVDTRKTPCFVKQDVDKGTLGLDMSVKIARYINRQLMHLTNELISMQKYFERKREEEMSRQSNSENGKMNNCVRWNYYINKKENPLKCFVYLNVPEGTVMLKPEKVDDNKNFLISINALNDIRRNNKEILKNIYFKKYEITFDHIYRNSNFITLLVNKFIDHPYLINSISFLSLTSSFYLLSDVFCQGVLHLLSSEIIWNPFIYNIWCNIHHTTLPLKLYLVKQTCSYGRIAFDFLVNYMRSKLIKLETSLINSSLKQKVNLDNYEENRYDDKNFTISTHCDISDEDEQDFMYI
ncbi:hypothetical protein, conserved [Plasmodium gonderi]|uniref:Uncharacterized protein n=1 Tax=Plasmodium gonderi TaxID=77519 RepID=A0A1Y1JIA1_PLAGO|nr:hypothetical protein, conserved [Plasmodium gonderi]GAW81358.1 hypothetical protein, conserved [Plasmodium gonderi]